MPPRARGEATADAAVRANLDPGFRSATARVVNRSRNQLDRGNLSVGGVSRSQLGRPAPPSRKVRPGDSVGGGRDGAPSTWRLGVAGLHLTEEPPFAEVLPRGEQGLVSSGGRVFFPGYAARSLLEDAPCARPAGKGGGPRLAGVCRERNSGHKGGP